MEFFRINTFHWIRYRGGEYCLLLQPIVLCLLYLHKSQRYSRGPPLNAYVVADLPSTDLENVCEHDNGLPNLNLVQ